MPAACASEWIHPAVNHGVSKELQRRGMVLPMQTQHVQVCSWRHMRWCWKHKLQLAPDGWL